MNIDCIDFVVTWVDSSDPLWQEEYAKYKTDGQSIDFSRYRDWNIFKYWFRAVEKYAPWVHKVFLVTNGQCPDWLDLNNPKIELVKHSDYIPDKYLPTFNSRCIELNMGRIKGLSDRFVYFNDDVFINGPITQDYYFKKGLPCDSTQENLTCATQYSPKDKFGISLSLYCNIAVLNYHFDRRKVVKQAFSKWMGPHLPLKYNFASLLLMGHPYFQSFMTHHVEQPYLKKTFEDIWEKEPDFLDQSCTRFRQQVSLTPYFARYWQLASNNFYPKKYNQANVFYLNEENLDKVIEALSSEKYKSICINDSPVCTNEFYESASKRLQEAFNNKFPEKSSFEK